MINNKSSHLQMPLLAQSQAQKEVTINDNFNTLDAILNNYIVTNGLEAPPTTILDGQTYIVGQSPTGIWVGKANYIASYYKPDANAAGKWYYINPRKGCMMWSESDNSFMFFDGSSWKKLSITIT